MFGSTDMGFVETLLCEDCGHLSKVFDKDEKKCKQCSSAKLKRFDLDKFEGVTCPKCKTKDNFEFVSMMDGS